MRWVIGFVLLGLSFGCPPIPKPQPPSPSNIPYCATAVIAVTPDVCTDGKGTANLFTDDGHVCVLCHGGSGCIAPGLEIYCIGSTNCVDALATHECSLITGAKRSR